MKHDNAWLVYASRDGDWSCGKEERKRVRPSWDRKDY